MLYSIYFLFFVKFLNAEICFQDGNCNLACNRRSYFFDFGDCKGCNIGCIDSYLNNNHCDPECFVNLCGYDKLECFNNCNEKCNEKNIGDGECDEECNTESCRYDGGDCDLYCSPGCKLSELGNFMCNQNCLTDECQFDRGDCDYHFYISPYETNFDFNTFPSISDALNNIYQEGIYYLHLSQGVHYLLDTISFYYAVGLVIVGNNSEIRPHGVSVGFNFSNLVYFSAENLTVDGSELWYLNCSGNLCNYAFNWICYESSCVNSLGDTISNTSDIIITVRENCLKNNSFVMFKLTDVINSKFSRFEVKNFGFLGGLVHATRSNLEVFDITVKDCEMFEEFINVKGVINTDRFVINLNLDEIELSKIYETNKVSIKNINFIQINSKNNNKDNRPCFAFMHFQAIKLTSIENAIIESIYFNHVMMKNDYLTGLIELKSLSYFSVSNIMISNSDIISSNLFRLNYMTNMFSIENSKSIVQNIRIQDSSFYSDALSLDLSLIMNTIEINNVSLFDSIFICSSLIQLSSGNPYNYSLNFTNSDQSRSIIKIPLVKIQMLESTNSFISETLIKVLNIYNLEIKDVYIDHLTGISLSDINTKYETFLKICLKNPQITVFSLSKNTYAQISNVSITALTLSNSFTNISLPLGHHILNDFKISSSSGNQGVYISQSESSPVTLSNFHFSNSSYLDSAIYSTSCTNLTILNSSFTQMPRSCVKLKVSSLFIKSSNFTQNILSEPAVTLEPLSSSSILTIEDCIFSNNQGFSPSDLYFKSSSIDSNLTLKSSIFKSSLSKSPSSISTDHGTLISQIEFINCLITEMISTSYLGALSFNLAQGEVLFINSTFDSNSNSFANSPVLFYNNENSDFIKFVNCEIKNNLNDVFLIKQNPNIRQNSFWLETKFHYNIGRILKLDNSFAYFEKSVFAFNTPLNNLIYVGFNSFLGLDDSVIFRNVLRQQGTVIEVASVFGIDCNRVVFEENDSRNQAIMSVYSSKARFAGVETRRNKANTIFDIQFGNASFVNVSSENDEYLYYFNFKVSDVSIDDSELTDVSNLIQASDSNISFHQNSFSNISESIFELLRSNLHSKDLKILSSPGRITLKYSTLTFTNLYLQDSTKVQSITSSLSIINSTLTNINLLTASSTNFSIKSSHFSETKKSLTLSNSILEVFNSTFESFEDTVFSIESSQISISNSIFKNNTGMQGGGLWISSSYLTLNSSQFISNKAVQGGGLYYRHSELIESNCTYKLNQAIHGTDKATPASFIHANASNNYSQSSGYSLTSISFSLQDSLNQTMFNDNSSIFLLISQNDSAQIRGSEKLSVSEGIISTQGTFLLSEPGSTTNLVLVSQSLDINISFSINLRDCEAGEVLTKNNICKACENNTYSLSTNDSFCKPCPSQAVCRGTTKIYPAAGYWAEASYPESFFPCSNPLACLTGEGLESNCAYSYKGTLCGSCIPGYKLKGSYNCTKCPKYWVSWLIVCIAAAVIAGLIGFMVFSNIKNTNKPKSEIALLLKIMVNYCQTILVLASIDLKWPESILHLFDFSTAVGESSNQVLNLSCSQLNTNNDSFLTSSAASALFPFALIAIIFVFWVGVALFKRNRNYIKVHFVSTCVIVILLFHTSVSNSILSIFSCKKINDNYWNTSDMSLKCFDGSHMRALLYVGVPGLVIWSITIPLITFSSLFFNREDLQNANMMIKYKMLFAGYKKELYFWELLIILRKFLIRVVAILLISSGITIQGLGIMIILIFSLTLHVNFRPYEKESINKLERYCIILLILFACGGIIFSTTISEDSKAVIGWLLFVLNIFFLLYWAQFFFNSVFSMIRSSKIFEKLKEKLLFRKKCKITINNEIGIKIEYTYKSNLEDLADKSIDMLYPKNPYNSYIENNDQAGDFQPRLNVWTAN